MFILLLMTTFLVALAVSGAVVFAFNRPINAILKRVVPAEISYAWVRYLRFAIVVVGVGGGVQVWALEKYLTRFEPYQDVVALTFERWMLELYNTIIGALQSSAIVLLVFFVFALIAMVIVQVFETRAQRAEQAK